MSEPALAAIHAIRLEFPPARPRPDKIDGNCSIRTNRSINPDNGRQDFPSNLLKAQVKNLLIPRINLVQMDRRASVAGMTGMASFFGGMFLSLVVVTLFIQERNVHMTGNALLLLYAACLIASGALAYLLVQLIGGNTIEVNDISAEFSERTVRLGDTLTIRTEDIRKVRIRRYKHGCVDVVLHLSNKGQLRIDPQISPSADIDAQRVKHCRLCELIQTHLAERWRGETAVPKISS